MKSTIQIMSRALCTFALALTGIAGCASGGPTLPAAQCPQPEVTNSEYVIGAGDTLSIVVWGNDKLSRTLPVRPDGKITIPLIDDIQAAGKTPSELADNMEGLLGKYLRTPGVSIIVTSQGAANQVQVIGEVLKAQSISYRYGLKMLDVVVAVGGLTEFAAGNRTDLVRQVGGKQIKCRINLQDLLNGDTSQNINVYPGDILVVPQTRF